MLIIVAVMICLSLVPLSCRVQMAEIDRHLAQVDSEFGRFLQGIGMKQERFEVIKIGETRGTIDLIVVRRINDKQKFSAFVGHSSAKVGECWVGEWGYYRASQCVCNNVVVLIKKE